ncbi:hypothetical protein M2351_005146 [Azospirillum canadense]|nr:hypothetical protein [Azospirillum canadense]
MTGSAFVPIFDALRMATIAGAARPRQAPTTLAALRPIRLPGDSVTSSAGPGRTGRPQPPFQSCSGFNENTP